MRRRYLPLQARIFMTVWLVYSLHFATNIVREHYPAFSLAERGTLRVDPYLGLHPDLFSIEGRGAFINNNPGASILGGLVYAPLRPLVDLLVAGTASRTPPEDSETQEYNDPRPLRREFFREVRERGLDLRFGLAAAVIHVLGVAPIGALAALAIFAVLQREGAPERQATLLSLLFAFGTPVFFRSATLSHNLLVAHFALFAFALIQRRSGSELGALRLFAAGLLAGSTVLCDFSGVVPLVALGLYPLPALTRGEAPAWRWGWMVAGGAVPIAALLAYQAWAFGSPWWPAQHYMPATPFSGQGWNGFSVPSPDLLLRNLFDPRYGLFAFGPLLLLAAGARWAQPGWAAPPPPARQRALVWGLAVGLLLFTSANQYAHLQWNTGFRMLTAVVPFLFLPAARVLSGLPRLVAVTLSGLAVLHSWALAMVREDAVGSVAAVLDAGPKLPWLTSLWRAGPTYLPWLETGGPRAWPLFVLLALVLWVVWRPSAGPTRVKS